MSAVQIPQSTTRTVMLKVFAAGTTTPATGKTVAVVLSKAGGAFANPSGGATNATEVANGWYSVALTTTDTGTLGDLVVRGTATGCDDSERLLAVVKATTGGLTALPDTPATTNASLLTSGAGTDQLSVSGGGVNATKQAGVTLPPPLLVKDAVTDASATSSAFKGSAALSSVDDAYKGLMLVFPSGAALAPQCRKISGYVGATRQFQFTGTAGAIDGPFSAAPTNGDTLVIIGHG